MQTFEFFIEDDRYRVPTLELVLVSDAMRARQLAAARLFASSHHQSIEVRRGDDRLFFVSRSGTPGRGGDARNSLL